MFTIELFAGRGAELERRVRCCAKSVAVGNQDFIASGTKETKVSSSPSIADAISTICHLLLQTAMYSPRR